MTDDKQPIMIKKYANRRLYNTGTSSYVTLEDLATMVKNGEDFVVFDAKTNEEITRPVLAQIIFEQETKEGQSLLPITFLRQLIRFYGNSMQSLVPSYLQYSIERLTADQHKFHDHLTQAFGTGGFGNPAFAAVEDQVRANMALFSKALTAFNPFAPTPTLPERANGSTAGAPASDLDTLRRQLETMQQQIDLLAKK